jgi:hypothetical protein
MLRGQCAHEYQTAVDEAVTFLIGAQSLLLEATSEGINEAVLNRLVSVKVAHVKSPSGMTRADVAFQARLQIIREALQTRHSKAPDVTPAQVAAYYRSHRSQFANPAVRHTRVVVTHSRNAALAALAALAGGESWKVVAKQWSIDSSNEIGGAFAVVEGEQPPLLEHAVFTSPRGRIVGPVSVPGEAGAPAADYVFQVTGAQPRSERPLAEVAPQIMRTLTEQMQERAWAAFSQAYARRWKAHTLCAPRYVVAECLSASKRSRAP